MVQLFSICAIGGMYPEFLALFEESEITHKCVLKTEVEKVFLQLKNLNYLCPLIRCIIDNFRIIQLIRTENQNPFSFDCLLVSTYKYYKDRFPLQFPCSCCNFFVALEHFVNNIFPPCSCAFALFINTLIGYFQTGLFSDTFQSCPTFGALAYFTDNYETIHLLDPQFSSQIKNKQALFNSQEWFFNYCLLQLF